MISLGHTADLERLVGAISGEMALVEVDREEGLVPSYTLLGELAELLAGDAGGREHCLSIQQAVGDCLDNGAAFDRATVDALGLYVEQIQCYLRYYRMGQGIAWQQLLDQWKPLNPEPGTGGGEQPAGAAVPESDTRSASPDTAADPFDCLMYLDLEESGEVLEEFHQEATEHLESIEAALLELESNPMDADAISSIFRSFHTIKGVAGFLDLKPIRVLAHEVETLLDLVRSGKLFLGEGVVSLILESRDRLQLLMEQVQQGLARGNQPEQVISVSDLIYRTHGFINGNPGEDEIEDEDADDDLDEPLEFDPQTAAKGTKTASQNALKSESGTETAGGANSAAAQKKRNAAASKAASIRMNTEKLDSIIDAVGELVIVESQLRDSILSSGMSSSRIDRNLAQLGRITGELQRSGLSLRMVSLKQLFQKMQRLARDLSSKSGKKVTFRVEGEETEMDRTVVEKIGDPLVHMIRNSMDHGIEPPQERIKAGKKETGEVVLRAYYQGDNIVLELVDDGRGIHSEKILKKAIERGLAQEGLNYTRDEILKFLFMPGFSTAEKVSDISGRGVGMDVVRSNVQKLRGRVDLISQEGRGSTIRICLPLTMAIIDGLLIRVGEERYILPVMNVNMTLKPKPGQIFSVQNTGKVIRHREKIQRLIHLGDFFGIPSDAKQPVDGVVVMVETDRMEYGLVVDEILHKQEVVVKNLGSSAVHPQGISGGAILGDGTISLILDPSGLIGAVEHTRTDSVA